MPKMKVTPKLFAGVKQDFARGLKKDRIEYIWGVSRSTVDKILASKTRAGYIRLNEQYKQNQIQKDEPEVKPNKPATTSLSVTPEEMILLRAVQAIIKYFKKSE